MNVKKTEYFPAFRCFQTILGIVLLLCGYFCKGEAEKIDALKPQGRVDQKFTFAQDKMAAMSILISKTASQFEQQAAEELKKGLEKITGATFEIRKETDNAIPEKPFISIGRTQAWENAELANQIKSIEEDGFCIQEKNGNLYLFGRNDKGTYHAVIGLLEEDLGCRWYGPGWDYYPRISILNSPVTNRVSNPAFGDRMPNTYLKNSYLFCLHNRVAGDPGELNFVRGWMCHTYENIYPLHDFSKHPEYFMIGADGKRSPRQLCPSNPEVQQLAEEKVREALRNNHDPNRRLIGISQNDVDVYCHCPACTAVIAQNGGAPVAAHLQLVNKVAAMMEKEFPQYRAVFLCYGPTEKPPTAMKIANNASPWYCFPITSVKLHDFRNLAAWAQLSKHVMIWDYMVDFSNYFMPYPSYRKIADALKKFPGYHVNYVFLQGKREGRGGDRIEKQAWVTSKLLWNPNLDYRTLMRDFNAGVYGPAAPAMDAYDELIEAAGRENKTIIEKYGLKDFIAQAAKLFAQAEKSLKDSGQTDLQPRLAYARLPLDTLELDAMTQDYVRTRQLNPQYPELLQHITELVQKERIGHYSEPVPMSKYLADHRLLLNSDSGKITVLPREMTIWGGVTGGGIVSDPLAEGKEVAVEKCTSNWAVQWPIPSTFLKPKTKYLLRALVRAERIDSQKPIWTAGVYDKTAKKYLASISVKAQSLSAKKYHWIDIGQPFIPQKDCFFWGSAIGNSLIYIQKLELMEVK